MLVNTWEFDFPSGCALLTLVVVVWSMLPSCLLRIQLRYWRKSSGTSMKVSGSLLWIVMRYGFISGDGKLWLRSGWICYSSSSVIKLSFVSSNHSSCSTSASSISYSCVSTVLVSSWALSIGLVWSYGSSHRTELTFEWGRSILAWVVPVLLDVSLLLLKSFGRDSLLWLFLKSCSMGAFLWMYNGPLKRQLSSDPSCFINNSLTPLLLIAHSI